MLRGYNILSRARSLYHIMFPVSSGFLLIFILHRENFHILLISRCFSYILAFVFEVFFMQHMLSLFRSCVDDYDMIQAGDRIAVGVSGGKDSLTLLVLLAELKKFYPRPFELEAFSVDMGLGGMDFSPVAALCEELGVPFHRIETQIGPVLFEYRKEKNPCSLCAKMRRGALGKAITEAGIQKVALGHHRDDAVETFLMSLIWEGRISCFEPVTYLDRTGVTQIRPMLYIPEQAVIHFAEKYKLPVVHNTCPADKHTKREEVKDLVYELNGRYPGLKDRIFGAMQRYPLAKWEIPRQQATGNRQQGTECGGADSSLR